MDVRHGLRGGAGCSAARHAAGAFACHASSTRWRVAGRDRSDRVAWGAAGVEGTSRHGGGVPRASAGDPCRARLAGGITASTDV